jgi:hypothetical protein
MKDIDDELQPDRHCAQGDHEKYAEIILRLASKMLRLAMSGIPRHERKRLTLEATKEAIAEIAAAGIELPIMPLFGPWSPPGFSEN